MIDKYEDMPNDVELKLRIPKQLKEDVSKQLKGRNYSYVIRKLFTKYLEDPTIIDD